MKIALDLDEVLSATLDELLKFHNEMFATRLEKKDIKVYELWRTWKTSQKQEDEELLQFFDSEYGKKVKPVKWAVQGVKELKKKHELYVVTARYALLKSHALEWIEKYFPNTFKKVYFSTDYNGEKTRKWKICIEHGFKVLVEDKRTAVLEAAENKVKAILLDNPWNQGELPENAKRVYNWKEIVKEVEKLEQ